MTVDDPQLALVERPIPPEIPGISFRQGEALTAIRDLAEAGETFDLITADPPWEYSLTSRAGPQKHYAVSQTGSAWIADALAAASELIDPKRGAYLAMWCTWPLLAEWTAETRSRSKAWKKGDPRWPWGPIITGGAWVKWNSPTVKGAPGCGNVWLGDSEFVLIYRLGKARRDRSQILRNADVSPRGRHSEKPIGWQRGWLRRWTPEGGRVLDIFSGLAPMARACLDEDREYVGIELDEGRILDARGLLAQHY